MTKQTFQERENATVVWNMLASGSQDTGFVRSIVQLATDLGVDATVTFRIPGDSRALEVRFADYGSLDEDDRPDE